MSKNLTGLPANTARSEPLAGLKAVMGFNGQMTEAGTGWQILGNGYRVYNPALMRFHSPDYLSPFGEGGLNAYAYCEGDPVNRVDPTGHYAWMAFLRLFITSAARVGRAVSMGVVLSKPIPAGLRLSTPGIQSRLGLMTRPVVGQLRKKMELQGAMLSETRRNYHAFKSGHRRALETTRAPAGKERATRYQALRAEFKSRMSRQRAEYTDAQETFRYARARVGEPIISRESEIDAAFWAEAREFHLNLKQTGMPNRVHDSMLARRNNIRL